MEPRGLLTRGAMHGLQARGCVTAMSGAPWRVLALGAPSHAALASAVERTIEALEARGDEAAPDGGAHGDGDAFADLCATAPPGGAAGRHRVALVARDGLVAVRLLRQWAGGEATAPHEEERWEGLGMVVGGTAPSGPAVPLCFLMSDVGTDWWGAGQWLLRKQDELGDGEEGGSSLLWGAKRSGLDAVAAEFLARGLPDPIALLRSPRDRWGAGATASAAESHSALFALHVALLSVWRELGVVPDAVTSFSMGEPSGAVACGALSETAGAAVMSAMTRCVAASEGAGGMLAVIGLPAEELAAQAALQDGVEVGAVFARAGGALTGSLQGIAAAEARLKADERVKVVLRPPVIKAPYHSAAFEPMQQTFCEELARVEPVPRSSGDTVPWFTSIDGGLTADAATSAGSAHFWFTGLRAPALSQRATEAALDAGYRLFLELNGSPFYCIHPVGDEMAERGLIGPNPQPEPLSGATRSADASVVSNTAEHATEPGQTVEDGEVCGLALCTIRHDVSEVPAEAQILGALCRLWVAGAAVDWSQLSATIGGHGGADKSQSVL